MPKYGLMNTNEIRSARLKAARVAAGFESAAAAAARFGWPYPTYAQHESGAGLGRSSARYARAFKVSEAWLLTGAGPGISPEIDEIVAAYQLLPERYQAQLKEYVHTLMQAAGIRAPGQEPPPS